MRGLHYLVFDVFTKIPFAGNQLGVVPDASCLSGEQMQAIARELSLAETIFFLPPEDPSHSAKVRIFMPNGELPFAGHPTIGGAIAYAGLNGLAQDSTVVLEEGVGPIRCRVSADAKGGRSSFVAVRRPQELAFDADVHFVASALRLSTPDIGFDDHKIIMVSAGVPYVTIPVKSLEVLARAKIDADKWLALDVERDGKFSAPYLYCRDGENRFRSRMFAPWDGIPEDPATGSAAVAFATTLNRFETRLDGDHAFEITQGVEMRRQSDIGLGFSVERGQLVDVTILGSAVKVASGTLFIPQ
jgi:trans-2,3-dihydro-3-hydroxyanthranilate isomerase